MPRVVSEHQNLRITKINKILITITSHSKGLFAFFDFCSGNDHQIVAHALVEALKVTQKLWIVRVEVAKVAQRTGFSHKRGTNYTLFCGLVRVQVE